MKSVKKHLNAKMKDVGFKEHYKLDLVKLQFIKPIIAYRIKHKLNQTALAKRVRISQQQISKIENGDFSSFDAVIKVLFAIGIEITKVQTQEKANSRKHISSKNSSLSHR
ncbi:MAG: helix-turn-helix transcriptional regulator [Candidatus Omnitrophica bacterium]|nr:helix-turn-helix transcriptional regulator [Candidatus Omnitrophota bacterium]